MALFITFEGGEGCGKTIQARELYKRLSKLAIQVILTQEPGGTPFGRKIAHLLKWSGSKDISPLAELLLFNASRADLVTKVIKPNLEEESVVICDRYTDSTTAYQGYGRGLDLAMVESINNTATRGLRPDLTILLEVPTEEGLARKRNARRDRFEREVSAFHQMVREGYRKLAAQEPERWLVLDATQSKEKVAQAIWQRVSQLLPVKEV